MLLDHLRSFVRFLKSTDFSRGVLMAIAAVSSLTVAYLFNAVHVGVAMALGALVSSPSDITGSFRRRNIGILISILLAVVSTIIAGYAARTAVFVPIFAVLVFFLALISVYGFRASLISFSGLLAVVLSLANINLEGAILVHSAWLGLGGLWYLILSVTLHFLNPGKETDEILSDTFELTADFLRIRADMLVAGPDKRQELQDNLAKLQAVINEKHETLRELVISRRVKSGKSGEARRKMLIVMELVDILEISMANAVNYERLDQLFSSHRQILEDFRSWNHAMADELQRMSGIRQPKKEDVPAKDLHLHRKRAGSSMLAYREEVGMPGARKGLLALRNLFDFKERQQEKLLSIVRLHEDKEGKKEFRMKTPDAARFISSQEYSSKTLLDNLDLRSPIFRHSLRLTVVMVAGYLVGTVFALQNTYWILLTSLVIMRPGYSLTRERSRQRLYGTLIGGAVASFIIIVTQNVILLAVLAIVTLILAFSMVQRNYKASAAFITVNIIFIYTLLSPNAFAVVQYRMLDTIIGASLAFLANSFLWPTWEYRGIKKFMIQSMKANAGYLQEISDFYQRKNQLPTSYKLARKSAFLAIGNLNSAFQRMTQEPKSRQKNLQEIYEIVTLNQEFLSSAASLGTFIAGHQTTEASGHFLNYVAAIQENIEGAIQCLEGRRRDAQRSCARLQEAEHYFEHLYKELETHRNRELTAGKYEISPEMRTRFQEAQLVREQLKWLLQISGSLRTQAGAFSKNKSHP